MASLSYLDVARLTGGVYMGGLMSVSELGLPTEFIYSEPITPDRLQASLYGTTLERYLLCDVIGKGLIDHSQAKGVPVIVGDSVLLSLATRVKRPLCCLAETERRPLSEVGEVLERTNEEFMAQLNEITSPYQFRIFDRVNFPVEQLLPSFTSCAERFNLVEPLSRVKRTLDLIRDQRDD